MTKKNTTEWWQEQYGFFGNFYLEGDNSLEGYLIKKQQNLAERTKTEVKGLIKLLKLSKGQSILDMPCGYGRHSLGLTKKGYLVTGVDINSVHLSVARKKAKQENLKIKFVKNNMREINYKETFDAAINLFYSFGFFTSDKENYQTLRNFYTALKPGGKFLMHTDVNIPRIIKGKYKEDEVRQLANGKKLHIIDRYSSKTKRIEGTWIITSEKNQEIRRDYSVRVYTKNEFMGLCQQVGFKKCRAYGDWEGNKYSKNSEDMIIVAEK